MVSFRNFHTEIEPYVTPADLLLPVYLTETTDHQAENYVDETLLQQNGFSLVGGNSDAKNSPLAGGPAKFNALHESEIYSWNPEYNQHNLVVTYGTLLEQGYAFE